MIRVTSISKEIRNVFKTHYITIIGLMETPLVPCLSDLLKGFQCVEQESPQSS